MCQKRFFCRQLTQFLPFIGHFSASLFRILALDHVRLLLNMLRKSLMSVGLLVLVVMPCLAHHMAVVVDKENKVGNVSSAHLAKILRSEIKRWPDGTGIVIVLHKASSGERTTLARLMKISDGDLQSFIATHKNSLKLVGTDADVLELVESMRGAVGLVDVRSVTSGINVVTVDGKLPTEDGYLPH